jgi:hypothetical protein
VPHRTPAEVIAALRDCDCCPANVQAVERLVRERDHAHTYEEIGRFVQKTYDLLGNCKPKPPHITDDDWRAFWRMACALRNEFCARPVPQASALTGFPEIDQYVPGQPPNGAGIKYCKDCAYFQRPDGCGRSYGRCATESSPITDCWRDARLGREEGKA